jgi:Protein of unknown function (DUF2868)
LFRLKSVGAIHLKLSELIDLEVQLLRDEQAVTGGRTADLARRDRAIGQHIAAAVDLPPQTAAQMLAVDRPLRHEVCRSWLGSLPSTDRKSLPGGRIERGYRWVGWLLFAVFVMMGAGAAAGATHFTATEPINVLVFIVVFFVLQVALLILYPVLLLIRSVRGGRMMPWLQGMIVRLSRVRFLDRLMGQSLADLPDTLRQLQVRQNIYGGVQKWMLFTLVQRMAMGFNLAALLVTIYMVNFQDLSNSSWSTTLELQTADLHRWLSWIASPFSWIDQAGAPSLDTIECSRWVTSGETGYATVPDGLDAEKAATLRRTWWWPFLIPGLITWGLLPRTIAYGVGRYMTALRSRRVPLNHMTVQHLFERLFPPTAEWSGPAPEDVRGAAPVAKKVRPRKASKLDPAAKCYVVCWGTVFGERTEVQAHVQARFHRQVAATFGAGLADVAEEQRTLAALGKVRAQRVVVVMPEGQQPTKDVTRFLGALRTKLGAECGIVVGLIARTADGFKDVDPDEIDTWRSRLLAEGDPYLSLQNMGRES